MLVGLNIETSEEHNTSTMQCTAQWTKPALNSPHACQNSGQNVLRRWLERQENDAYAMAHKQGIKVQLSRALKK